MKIKNVIFSKSYTGFYFDDQKAIKMGADHDGFMYLGEAKTEGFSAVRQTGEAISIQLVLEDGSVAYGDCAAVQYSGAGGRGHLPQIPLGTVYCQICPGLYPRRLRRCGAAGGSSAALFPAGGRCSPLVPMAV